MGSLDYDALLRVFDSSDATWTAYYQKLDAALDLVEGGYATFDEAERMVYESTGRYIKPLYAYGTYEGGNGKVLTGFDFSEKPTYMDRLGSSINSNAATVERGIMRTPIESKWVTTTGGEQAIKLSKLERAGKVFFNGPISGGLFMASAGISLGRAIDSAIYSANPDFWNDNAFWNPDPVALSRLIMNYDYPDPISQTSALLFNAFFGVDVDGVTAYVDENAFAYVSSYLATSGKLDMPVNSADETYVEEFQLATPIQYVPVNFTTPAIINGVTYYYSPECVTALTSNGNPFYFATRDRAYGGYATIQQTGVGYYIMCAIASDDSIYVNAVSPDDGRVRWSSDTAMSSYTYNGLTVKRRGDSMTTAVAEASSLPHSATQSPVAKTNQMAWTMAYGTPVVVSDGLPVASGATVADPAQMQTPADALQYLQTTYPDMWSDAVDYDVANPDGTTTTHRYVPIVLPYTANNGDTQPTSVTDTSTRTQTDTKVEPSTDTQIKTLVEKLIQTPTDNPYDNPPAETDPSPTGSGSVPATPAPTGEASALWSIYNPTQAQVDALGAWLWSSAFVDQILKIFNNPMESIIGLHKIYATPSTSGSADIKVGYLSSGVSAAVVSSQYATVDCGSISLSEDFGSVLDYAPYTDVKIYLPFIGIMPLSVADVMRSTISVIYHVDVLSGACLAEVKVTRDGGGGTLYQYAGDASVKYPVSAGSYMGIVAGIAGAVTSVAATVATGGGALPAIIGAGGSLSGAHTSVQNSGTFGGNAGAMGGKKPYLIVSRPQSKIASRYAHMQGYPTNHTSTVGACSGFIRAKSVRSLDAPATGDELDEIKSLLMEGVIA